MSTFSTRQHILAYFNECLNKKKMISICIRRTLANYGKRAKFGLTSHKCEACRALLIDGRDFGTQVRGTFFMFVEW